MAVYEILREEISRTRDGVEITIGGRKQFVIADLLYFVADGPESQIKIN